MSDSKSSSSWSVGSSYEDLPLDLVPKVQSSLYSVHDSRRLRSLEYRLHYLKQIGYLLQDNIDAICASVKADLGREKTEVMMTEVWPLMSEVELAIERVQEWMSPESGFRDTPWGFALNNPMVRKEPKGPGLIVTPWNYPWLLTFSPLMGAIAAGCPAVVKPSEHGPHCSLLVGQLVQKYLDPTAHIVIFGDASLATSLLDLKWGHVFFTGSTAIGRKVAVACARNLVPYTLELGGKSPVIISPDADLKMAARRIISMKATGAGQMCTNADYVLVPKSLLDKWMKACESTLEQFYKNDAGNAKDVSTMIHTPGYDRVTGFLNKARESGKVVLGGQTHSDQNVKRLSTACVLMDGNLEGEPLMQEEIFGPILPIVPVENVDAAIAFVNSRPSPLALYVFSAKTTTYRYVLDRTLSGGACWNDIAFQTVQRGVPFGGVGESGTGAAHGRMSFETFTHRRSSFEVPAWMELLMSYRYPPTKPIGYKVFKAAMGPDLTFKRSTSIQAEKQKLQRSKMLRRLMWVVLAAVVVLGRKVLVGGLIRGLSKLA